MDELVSFIAGSEAVTSPKPEIKVKKAKPKSKKSKKKSSELEKGKDTRDSENHLSSLQVDLIGESADAAAKKVMDNLTEIMSDDMWVTEEDDLDPELKAAQDREVEEFRMRLESIQPTVSFNVHSSEDF